MPKVVHINCSTSGSTGMIIGDIANYAAQKGYTTLLCAPGKAGSNKNIRYLRATFPYEQGIYRRLNIFYGFQYGFAPFSTARILAILKKEKPDLIHIHCVNGHMVNVYSLLHFIKKHSIPSVITNHAEFFYTGSCPYAYFCDNWMTGCGKCPQGSAATGGRFRDTSSAAWRRMRSAFSGLDRSVMVSVSPWVYNRAAVSPITRELAHRTVFNGVNTDIFTYRDPAVLRKKYGFSQTQKIVFHPTAHFSDWESDRKGGRYLIRMAKQMADTNTLFLVAGKHTPDLKVPENMILLESISDKVVLAEYYSLADVTVLTSQRETFSMPVAESLCCGTPVVGFLAGGPESIGLKDYCRFVNYEDVNGLEYQALTAFHNNIDKYRLSQLAKGYYSADIMAEQYIRIYSRLLAREEP